MYNSHLVPFEPENKEHKVRAINRFEMHKLYFPVDGYMWDVQTWTSVDGGKTFWHCGIGRYFNTEAEAVAYKAEMEQKEKDKAQRRNER